MSQNLSSAAVVIGALRVKYFEIEEKMSVKQNLLSTFGVLVHGNKGNN